MGAIITLTTDFGLTDAYAAAMKGVILSINPEAKLIDICHLVKPQDIFQAAFILSTAYQFFPPKTIHVVVVDPGVGTERRAIILRTPAADFIAPDNGVLSYIISSSPARAEGSNLNQPQRRLEPEWEAVAISKSQFWRSSVSATFHGRDIFAPVAAHLSLGWPLKEFGERVSSLTVLPLPDALLESDSLVVGHIIHIDHFGNLMTDIRGHDLPPPGETITIEVNQRFINGLSHSYAEGKELLALLGSSGYLEIALKGGNASAALRSKVGDEVRVKLKGGGGQ